jgi:hypothetical protein
LAGILVCECLQIDIDGEDVIKFWYIEHEVIDFIDLLAKTMIFLSKSLKDLIYS